TVYRLGRPVFTVAFQAILFRFYVRYVPHWMVNDRCSFRSLVNLLFSLSFTFSFIAWAIFNDF
ncbi:hypothetical protein, partial [Klebsiella aerogenes]|uniref:hypothetical protein n=1 Tax=Klebsiella aerogenes TaxID=548 RepID=UPI001CC6F6C7